MRAISIRCPSLHCLLGARASVRWYPLRMTQRSAEYEAVMGRLAEGGRLLLDGGVGTEVQRQGGSLNAWAALANVERPDVVSAAHRAFTEVGADFISTNTFGCSEPRLAAAGITGRMEELNRAAVGLALEERERAERQLLVAGCMTTVGFRGEPGVVGATPEGEWALASQAQVLADAGADLIIVEMLSEVEHANVQLAAAASAGLPVWAGFSSALNGAGQMALLNEPDEPLEDSLRRIDLSGVDAALVMHTTIDVVGPALEALRGVWPGPSGAYPHGGRWMRPTWEFDPGFTPEILASSAVEWLAGGHQIVGGCCGSTAEHIRVLREVVDAAG